MSTGVLIQAVSGKTKRTLGFLNILALVVTWGLSQFCCVGEPIKLYQLFIERLDTNKERTNFLQNLIKNIDKKLIDIEKILEDIEEYFVGISEYRMEDLARYQIFQMMNYLKEFDLIKRLIFDINVFLNSLPEQWKRNELVGNIEENLMRIDAIIDQIDQYTNEDV